VGFIIGFFVVFILVFGVGALGALLSDEPWNNTLELVQYALPFVTALGGYIVSHYFPAPNPPQIPGGQGNQQG
jgi:VIT1/CCC1 family predicted Fe2+/Mn2+ transporter